MTITLEQWRKWAATATRNYTDAPIGAMTDGKRQADAMASEIFTERSEMPTIDRTQSIDTEGRAA